MDLVKKSLELFPDQCEQAWNESSNLSPLGWQKANIRQVVVCGMGGSRFPPLTIKYLYEEKIKTPYLINDTSSLPGFADKNTLVILSSYSGTTEEVLACAEEAESRNCLIAAIASGGELKKLTEAKNLPAYIFEPKNNPSGQPRLGVGYMLMGHLGLLKSFGLLDIEDNEAVVSIDYAKKIISQGMEKYEELGKILQDKYPFIIVAEHLRGFANGFANQINENAKAISDFRFISELNHHLMEGLEHPKEFRDRALFLFFRSDLYHHRIKKRFGLTEEVVSKQGIKTYTIKLEGKKRLDQILEAFILSGFTTYHLAKLYGVDPLKIPWVNYFKTKLGQPLGK